jgi:hypothetical protein
MPFDVGDSVPIAVDVKDAAGTLTNATVVTLTITLPDGTTVTPSVTNPPAVTGLYRATYVPTVEGRFAWRFVTTTPNTAYQDVFVVRGVVSPALLSLADAKAHLNIPVTSTSNDDELREFLEAATEVIEQRVGPVARRTLTAQVWGGEYRIYLPKTQVLDVTAITLVSDGSSPVDLLDLNINAHYGSLSRKSSATFPDGLLNITYVVGRTAVPANVTNAAKLIVKHLWRTQLGNAPSVQEDDRGYVVTGSGYMIPYRVLGELPDEVPLGLA